MNIPKHQHQTIWGVGHHMVTILVTLALRGIIGKVVSRGLLVTTLKHKVIIPHILVCNRLCGLTDIFCILYCWTVTFSTFCFILFFVTHYLYCV